MLQHQLTSQEEKCDHGYYFGTTCERCIIQRISNALGKHAEWQYDVMFGAVQGVNVYDPSELVRALEDLQNYSPPPKQPKRIIGRKLK